jgi:hypothetical protein
LCSIKRTVCPCTCITTPFFTIHAKWRSWMHWYSSLWNKGIIKYKKKGMSNKSTPSIPNYKMFYSLRPILPFANTDVSSQALKCV